ncbi:hypothetical protein DENIS_1629 [Desulfonema ishimotonii]|uniref:Uncharacterized protein n=1 Tax=Desulfonema ishimotonii TaxID=45657 RepID=A0A401FUM4_9BACT|nr:hypothetical protein DENIS_1629 [Desulfonema ishimotonii]
MRRTVQAVFPLIIYTRIHHIRARQGERLSHLPGEKGIGPHRVIQKKDRLKAGTVFIAVFQAGVEAVSRISRRFVKQHTVRGFHAVTQCFDSIQAFGRALKHEYDKAAGALK